MIKPLLYHITAKFTPSPVEIGTITTESSSSDSLIEIFDELKQNNIVARKYFYPLLNELECYKDFPTADVSKTPIAKHIGDCVLTLPLYADISIDTVDRICDLIVE